MRGSQQQTDTLRPRRGFTLIELMVVVALALILITLAAPSVKELLAMQRLQSVHTTLVTDLQYARAEAVRRNTTVSFEVVNTSDMSCYVAYINTGAFSGGDCDCRRTPGSACTGSFAELRTVQVPKATSVSLAASSSAAAKIFFFPKPQIPTGAAEPSYTNPGDWRVDVSVTGRGVLRAAVNSSGFVTACSPSGSVKQVAACP